MRRVLEWLKGHGWELAIFGLGAVLRVSMHFTFDPAWGYDSHSHLDVAKWILDNGRVPPVTAVFCAYHPPLYYAIAALMMSVGATAVGLQWFSIVAGIIKLGLVWLGLTLYLERKAARIAGLALAAVLPVAVHMDGMNNNEVTSSLFATAAVVIAPAAFASEGRRRWLLAGVIGVLLAAQLMSKIAGMASIAAIGIGAVLELVLSRAPGWKARIWRLLPWSLVVLIPLLASGWYFGRNVRDYGKPFVTAFDLHAQFIAEAAPHRAKPWLERRPPSFVFGWDTAVYGHPYIFSALGDDARFFPAMIAMTFVDYWNFRFTGMTAAPEKVNGFPMTPQVMTMSRRSNAGGTVISALIAATWLACLVWAIRRRKPGYVAALSLPVMALAGQFSYAVDVPLDFEGNIKASYVQFGMAPLYAVFGVGVAWLLDRRKRWPVFAIVVCALWLVAAYTLYCRLRIVLLPL